MNDREFQRIVKYVKLHYGIELIEKRTLITGRLTNYLLRKGYSSYDEYMNKVESDITGQEAKNLINILSTNHTYFMREFEQFEFYKDVVLKELKNREQRKKSLGIWCAAASTGEEPYTLAMVTKDFFALASDEWDTRILATDINTKVLQKAKEGMYLKEQIEPLPQTWTKRYFRKVSEETYQVKDELKKEVIFRQYNLMDPILFKSRMHVVFLRNVMIYFNDKTKSDLINRIYDCMEPGGYLFIGASESIEKTETNFHYVRPSIYRK